MKVLVFTLLNLFIVGCSSPLFKVDGVSYKTVEESLAATDFLISDSVNAVAPISATYDVELIFVLPEEQYDFILNSIIEGAPSIKHTDPAAEQMAGAVSLLIDGLVRVTKRSMLIRDIHIKLEPDPANYDVESESLILKFLFTDPSKSNQDNTANGFIFFGPSYPEGVNLFKDPNECSGTAKDGYPCFFSKWLELIESEARALELGTGES